MGLIGKFSLQVSYLVLASENTESRWEEGSAIIVHRSEPGAKHSRNVAGNKTLALGLEKLCGVYVSLAATVIVMRLVQTDGSLADKRQLFHDIWIQRVSDPST